MRLLQSASASPHTHIASCIAAVLCITRPLSASCVMAQEHHERCALRAGEASEGHAPINLCAACTKRQSSYHMQLYFLKLTAFSDLVKHLLCTGSIPAFCSLSFQHHIEDPTIQRTQPHRGPNHTEGPTTQRAQPHRGPNHTEGPTTQRAQPHRGPNHTRQCTRTYAHCGPVCSASHVILVTLHS